MATDIQLRTLGKKAAYSYLTNEFGDTSLSDAVARQLKKEAADLNDHQIDRVCEAANHACWQKVFAGPDKTAGFHTALRSVVKQKMSGKEDTVEKTASVTLQNGNLPGFMRNPSAVFAGAPIHYHSMTKGELDDLNSFQKTAQKRSPTADFMVRMNIDPVEPLKEMWDDIQQFKTKIAADMRSAKNRFDEHAVRFCEEAVQAYYDKLPLDKIASALKQMPAPEPWRKAAFVDFVRESWDRSEIPVGDVEDIYNKATVTKTAHPNHPLLVAFRGMVKEAANYIAADSMWRDEILPVAQKLRKDLQQLEKSASVAGDAVRGIAQGAANVLGGGAKLVGAGVQGAGQLAIDHPVAALSALGAGYFFGRPALDFAVDHAVRMKDHIQSGWQRPADEFSSLPTELPLDEVMG